MINAELKNINKVLKQLDKFGADAKDKIDFITEQNAQDIEANAKSRAVVDNGFMRNQIATTQSGDLSYKVTANAPYSAYVEFGTGGLVDVPEELKDIAIQFKGKGIRQINLRPRPFLYPAFVKGRKQYLKDLKKLLQRLTKKYGK